MDIEEFLDRELSDLGLQTDKTEGQISLPEFKEQVEPSPLVEGIKANISKGNLELAEQAYAQLWHILIQQKLKWNKELYEQLSILSKQFISALSQAYNEVKRKSEHINELISRARAALREGRKEVPFKLYSEIEGIYNSIQDVFFEEKKIVEEQIMDFYKELKSTTDNELVKRVYALVQEINQLIDKINLAIRANDMINATVNYNKCIELYSQVPEGFLRHRNSIGIRLLDIYKSISIYNEISNLQRQLSQQTTQQIIPQQTMGSLSHPQKSMLLHTRKERAKRNIEKGFYNEASKDIEEALQIEPNDAEAKAIHAKIKTLQ